MRVLLSVVAGLLLATGILGPGVAHAGNGSIVKTLKKAKFHLRRLGCRHEITEEAHQKRVEKGYVYTFCINCGEHVKARSHYLYPELFNFVEFEGGLSSDQTDELRKQYGKE